MIHRRKTATNDTQGTPIQGGPNGSGTPGEMPSGGGFPKAGDSFAGKFIDFLSRGMWTWPHPSASSL